MSRSTTRTLVQRRLPLPGGLALALAALAASWAIFHPDAALAGAIFSPSGTVGSKVVGIMQDLFQGVQWLGYGCAGVGGSACAIQAMGGRPPTGKAITITSGAAGVGLVGSIVNGLMPDVSRGANLTNGPF